MPAEVFNAAPGAFRLPISHLTWQQLRHMVRNESRGVPLSTGAELRITPGRATRDGTFLDALVRMGLIVRAGPIPGPVRPSVPDQFKWHYGLTEKGREAAEFGEAVFTREERGLTPLALKSGRK